MVERVVPDALKTRRERPDQILHHKGSKDTKPNLFELFVSSW